MAATAIEVFLAAFWSVLIIYIGRRHTMGLVKTLRLALVYAKIPFLYMAVGLLKLMNLVAPEFTINLIKSRRSIENPLLKNIKTADDMKFMFSDEVIKVMF